MFCISKKRHYVLHLFQKLTQIVKKKLILLMIPNYKEEVWHYLAVKKLSPLLRKITLKNNGNFYCLNYLQFFRNNRLKTDNKLKSH